ncbi:AcrR family transcriptional regulator [Kibdelosporangium banguiense]|uniref:AcrR family transcriptional regulator n=1 Tax=Kibdelosporangium banguiense TaxID=1365924 RepID=A0ABS4TP85_9PSEU|nr:TetR/AcrR family transcriptional regulator [Kibdelosporangium banguiense]MBP2325733.1 AcrR family transcriptional regulator [Kibdelosporangium banguiense]
MSTRRTDLLDAAITLLGEQGVRALTHRAVDATAGLPPGSAANHFSTRDALIKAVAERISDRERARWEELAPTVYPTTPAELAEVMIMLARQSTGPDRALTLARYAILGEAANQPGLRDHFLSIGSRVDAYFLNWVRAAGSPRPERDAPLIMNHWTGLVLHQLAIPDPAFAAAGQITDLMHTLEKSWTPTRSGTRSTRIG